MKRKNQSTSDFILEKVSPIFNKKGYAAASLSDLTKATKLTKGALYCNFKNKEELALKSFQYTIEKYISPLDEILAEQNSSVAKLHAFCNYYRTYYHNLKKIGGCPILNIGNDAKFNNPKLYNAARKVSKKLLMNLILIIQNGVNQNEFRKEVSAKKYANLFYSIIEGSMYMSCIHENPEFLGQSIAQIELIIENEF